MPQEREASAPVDLNELLRGEQGAALAQMARASVFSHTLLDRISEKKFDEPGVIEAVAMTIAGKTGENPRYQPQTAPAAS